MTAVSKSTIQKPVHVDVSALQITQPYSMTSIVDRGNSGSSMILAYLRWRSYKVVIDGNQSPTLQFVIDIVKNAFESIL